MRWGTTREYRVTKVFVLDNIMIPFALVLLPLPAATSAPLCCPAAPTNPALCHCVVQGMSPWWGAGGCILLVLQSPPPPSPPKPVCVLCLCLRRERVCTIPGAPLVPLGRLDAQAACHPLWDWGLMWWWRV
jgi:hypothetical protein